MANFVCNVCSSKFIQMGTLNRHIKAVHGYKIKCPQCEKTYTRTDSMKEHFRKKHMNNPSDNLAINNEIEKSNNKRKLLENDDPPSSSNVPKKRRCITCEIDVSTSEWTHHSRTNDHKRKSRVPVINTRFNRIRHCFEGKVETYSLENTDEGVIDINIFLKSCKTDIIQLIGKSFETKGSVKFSIELFAEFIKYITVH